MSATDMKSILNKIAIGGTLEESEATAAFEIMMTGEATPSQMGAFLMGLRVRGETVEEITGAATVMRAKANRLKAPPGAIDTCGTGGDALGTFNVSTAAAFVAAACGVTVAKHGNRAMSSKSGSADVLSALGVNINADMGLVSAALWDVGIAFLLAPRHHGAMRHVGGTRVELGTRTIFNLLGPLSNPAGAKRQLIGVFDRKWTRPLAEVLSRLGSDRVWIVHGEDGMDELTTTGVSYVAELRKGEITEFEVDPESVGLKRASLEDLKGGDPGHNAVAMRTVFSGEKNAYRDIIVLNAGAALMVAGKAKSLQDAVAEAEAAIDDGRVTQVLDGLVEVTNRHGTEDHGE